MAALGPDSKASEQDKKPTRSTVMLVHQKDGEFALCSLALGQCNQQPLDIVFLEGEEIHLRVTGAEPVHLTGYYINVNDNDYDDDYDGEYDSEEINSEDELGSEEGLSEEPNTEDEDFIDDESEQVTSDDDEDDEDDEEFYDSEEDEDEEELDSEEEEERIRAELKSKRAANDSKSSSSKKENKQVKFEADLKKPRQEIKEEKPSSSSFTKNKSQEREHERGKKNQPSSTPTFQQEKKATSTPQQEKKATSTDSQDGKKSQESKNASKTSTPVPVKDASKNTSSGKNETSSSSTKKSNNDTRENSLPSNASQSEKILFSKVLNNGLKFEDIKVGHGTKAKSGKRIGLSFSVRNEAGKEISSSKGNNFLYFTLGRGDSQDSTEKISKAIQFGVQGMNLGGERKITIPSSFVEDSNVKPTLPKGETAIITLKLEKVDQDPKRPDNK